MSYTMTAEESVLYYENQQAYRRRREEFNEELAKWFEEKYKPKVSETQ